MELQITEEQREGMGRVLALRGRIDAVTAPQLKSKLKDLVAEGQNQLVVDLTEVSFIDSSGLSTLVSGLRASRESGGTLKLVGLNEQTRTAFRLTQLDRVFEILPDGDSFQ